MSLAYATAEEKSTQDAVRRARNRLRKDKRWPRDEHLPESLIVHWMAQLVSAVCLLHSQGVIIRYIFHIIYVYISFRCIGRFVVFTPVEIDGVLLFLCHLEGSGAGELKSLWNFSSVKVLRFPSKSLDNCTVFIVYHVLRICLFTYLFI